MTIEDAAAVRAQRRKTYIVTFENRAMAELFRQEGFDVLDVTGATATVSVKGNLQEFLKAMENYRVANLDVKTESLEEIFMHYYGGMDS